MAWTYARTKEELARARDPYLGRPIQNKTRVVLVSSSITAIQHHSTEIVRFHEDGRVQIHTGWTSNSTLARVYDYSGHRIWNKRTKAINGFRPMQDRFFVITNKDGRDYVFNSVDNYITIKPDGYIDLATIRPRDFTAVSDPVSLRKARRQISLLARQVAVVSRLGHSTYRSSSSEQGKWLRTNAALPFAEVDWVNAPSHIDYNNSPVMLASQMGMVLDYSRMEVV